MDMKFEKHCWAEIDLDALRHNFAYIRQAVGGPVCAVVKADAYGHGDVATAKAIQQAGVAGFAVSSLGEGHHLRHHGITIPILILGYTGVQNAAALAVGGISQTVFSLEYARALSEAALRAGVAVRVHLKVDTGMGRIGFTADDDMERAVAEMAEACALPGLVPVGVFTHFAAADSTAPEDIAYTRRQYDILCAAVEEMAARGCTFAVKHCCNSAGTFAWPEFHLDMVRPGLLLYGYGEFAQGLDLRPVMTLKTTISTTKTYEPGTSVSYGRLFTTQRRTRMGVVPYGYADGFFRCLSDRCSLMTAKGPAPQRGRICMDMSMIDLTDLPGVDVGDEVEIFGPHNPVEVMAAQAGTIPYELTCAVSKRVPRVYLQNGQVTERELLLRF